MKLTTNENTADRAIRIVLGIVLIAAGAVAGITVPLVYVAWVVAAILLVTGAAGFCPLYAMLGLSTARK